MAEMPQVDQWMKGTPDKLEKSARVATSPRPRRVNASKSRFYVFARPRPTADMHAIGDRFSKLASAPKSPLDESPHSLYRPLSSHKLISGESNLMADLT
jgi:hypothetical protein